MSSPPSGFAGPRSFGSFMSASTSRCSSALLRHTQSVWMLFWEQKLPPVLSTNSRKGPWFFGVATRSATALLPAMSLSFLDFSCSTRGCSLHRTRESPHPYVHQIQEVKPARLGFDRIPPSGGWRVRHRPDEYAKKKGARWVGVDCGQRAIIGRRAIRPDVCEAQRAPRWSEKRWNERKNIRDGSKRRLLRHSIAGCRWPAVLADPSRKP